MAAKNYLPFVAREALVVPAGEARSLSVLSTYVATRDSKALVYYKDMFTRFGTSTSYDNLDLLCRYGFQERGYLLEEPLPVLRMASANYSLSPFQRRNGFEFPKPYRLEPGQSMLAELEPEEEGVFGMSLKCMRVLDDAPFLLYGTQLTPADTPVAFSGASMRCPADSALLVKNFQIGGTRSPMGVVGGQMGVAAQLYDANGRPIVTTKVTGAAGATFTRFDMLSGWMNSQQAGFELGEHNGWALPASNPLIAEYENQSDTDEAILVTVRGSVEVL